MPKGRVRRIPKNGRRAGGIKRGKNIARFNKTGSSLDPNKPPTQSVGMKGDA